MPIANGRTPPQCRDGANFVRLGHCGAGHPELLSARFPPRPLEPCDALGRSQVVRQRILIPPSGGSNPPAPATHSRNWETSPYAAQSPAFCGPLRTRRLETDGTGRVAAVLSARSPMPIFQSPEFASGRARPARAGSHAAGLTARSADATRACARFRCFGRAGGEPDQPRPNCSSCSVQGSRRFRVSCVTVGRRRRMGDA